MKYKTDERFISLQREQIWEMQADPDVYDKLADIELDQIREFLPREPKVILELGSGLGRGSIYLNRFYSNKPYFILADRTGRTENTGAFKPDKDEYYNDLDLTREFCLLNGLNKFELLDTELGDWSKLPRVDLVFSTFSFGVHVAIERYLDRILSVCNNEVTMIFGVRHYGPESFKDQFREVTYQPGAFPPPMPVQNWLFLVK